MTGPQSEALRNAMRDLDVAIDKSSPGWIRNALVFERRRLEALHAVLLGVASGVVQDGHAHEVAS